MALETVRRRAAARRELVESKLDAPAVRPGTVARSAVVERLRASRTAAVVEVVAPAGYGKTTLLAHWEARDRRPFAWLSLDAADNDPRVLLAYLAAALDRVSALDERLLAAPSAPRLGAALASLPPLVLVLDDVHSLREPECLEVLALLVEHLGERSTLALAGRSEPRLPLARLRAQGRLLEVRLDELAFDGPGAQALLQGAGLPVPPSQAEELAALTEGWPVGLYLAALARREGGTPSFGGGDRFVTDYLRLEVLAGLPPDELVFLRRAAVLDRLCGPLCDAVLARTGSASLLEALERTGRFLVPLDRERRWYRFHRLFRQVLAGELERCEPELVRELNERAATWCSANGAAEEAIAYAEAAGDVEQVARLVATLALPACDGGRLTTAARWIERLDGERDRHPGAAVAAAWISALCGRADEAERWAGLAAAHDPGAALAAAAICRDGPARMLADARRADERLGAAGGWRPTSLLLLGAAHLLCGEAPAADAAFEAAAAAASIAAAPTVGSLALAERSLLAEDEREADALAQQAWVLVARAGLDDYPATALVLAATARAAARRGESAAARADLAAAARLRPRLTHALPWLALQARLELVRAHLALADHAAARTLLAEADEILRRRPDLGALAAEADELREHVTNLHGPAARWAATLTDAELRLLPLLTTHLSFREIAGRLYVSRNTVKTQAVSMYRKLGASSRAEAVERAAALGLLAASAVPPPQRLLL